MAQLNVVDVNPAMNVVFEFGGTKDQKIKQMRELRELYFPDDQHFGNDHLENNFNIILDETPYKILKCDVATRVGDEHVIVGGLKLTENVMVDGFDFTEFVTITNGRIARLESLIEMMIKRENDNQP